MGYDVHITLADDWTESDAAPIPIERWLRYVDSDPDMRLDGYAESATSDGTLRYESEGLAVWTAYSGRNVGGNQAWFDYRDGRIVVKNPNEEILAKMMSIADALGAKLIGDDGEQYPEQPNPRSNQDQKLPWWRFW